MSTTILYRSFGIQLAENQYILVAEIGSNNCYESDRKRARDWSGHRILGGKFYYTIDELEESLEKEKKDYIGRKSYNEKEVCTEENFGWFAGVSLKVNNCRKTTWGMYYNFFMKPILKTDKYEDICGKVWLELRFSLIDYRGQDLRPENITLSPENAIETIDYWVNELKNNPMYKNVSMRIRPCNIDTYLENQKFERNIKKYNRAQNLKMLSTIKVKRIFVIKNNTGLKISNPYLGKINPHDKYLASFGRPESAFKFPTKEAAQKKLEELAKKFHIEIANYDIVKCVGEFNVDAKDFNKKKYEKALKEVERIEKRVNSKVKELLG